MAQGNKGFAVPVGYISSSYPACGGVLLQLDFLCCSRKRQQP